MKKSQFTEQQIAFALHQAETGTSVDEVCRKMGISEQTFYQWKKRYGGLMPSEVRRLKQLEEENARLRCLVSDLSLDKEMLQEVIPYWRRPIARFPKQRPGMSPAALPAGGLPELPILQTRFALRCRSQSLIGRLPRKLTDNVLSETAGDTSAGDAFSGGQRQSAACSYYPYHAFI